MKKAIALAFALLSAYSGGETITLSSANDLIKLSNDVNGGNFYTGTTVLLDKDIDFTGLSDKFAPIGSVWKTCFRGVFDGQGHTVSNLKVTNSTYGYYGLFGFSWGTSIRNVIMDSTCAISGSFFNSNAKKDGDVGYVEVGGVIGECEAFRSSCKVESCINMGKVELTAMTAANTDGYIGGVVGNSHASGYGSTVTNCVNYGALTFSGEVDHLNIGGVAGSIAGKDDARGVIQNCLNYGAIMHSGKSRTATNLGGVLGVNGNGNEEIISLLNMGPFAVTQKKDYRIGALIGYFWKTTIAHSYWSGRYEPCGFVKAGTLSECANFSTTTFALGTPVTVGKYTGRSLLDALNAGSDAYAGRGYAHWLLDKDNKPATFRLNKDRTLFKMNSQLILMPNLANEGTTAVFDGWYTDEACTAKLTNFEVKAETVLYGKWGNATKTYTITFDTRDGLPVAPITGKAGTVVELPKDITKGDSCELGWWESNSGVVAPWSYIIPPGDVTLHAAWYCTKLRTAEDLVDFSKMVNAGKSFEKKTVTIDADIYFTSSVAEKFVPIGYSRSRMYVFDGTFDGQGYLIRNLAVKSAGVSRLGLFGSVATSVIKNVVLDASCSFESQLISDSDSAYVGGVVGWFNANREASIEGCVNMATVTFSGNTEHIAEIGGIAGSVSASLSIAVKNCVNYGAISFTGTSTDASLGGLIGNTHCYETYTISVLNSANYGTVSFAGTSTTANMYIGGISGVVGASVYIENTLSAGKATTTNTSSIMGTVVGLVDDSFNTIANSYWTSDVGAKKESGSGTATLKSNKLVTLDAAAQATLNKDAESNGWSKWILLNLNGGKINGLPQDYAIVTDKRFMSPVKVGSTFSHWCTDAACTKKYDPMTSGDVAQLYAAYI